MGVVEQFERLWKEAVIIYVKFLTETFVWWIQQKHCINFSVITDSCPAAF
jgi:hypothetical protein